MSETSLCRIRLKKFCAGYGLDIGYGGDPIIPSAITVDLPEPYTNVGNSPLNLGGDARDLFWFKDNVLDYVYSSHLLEDFNDTLIVLKEWLRIIKPGGYLILFCPDEQIYRAHCKKTEQSYNYSHKIDNFSLDYVKTILIDNFINIEIVHENPLVDVYSFELVLKKTIDNKDLHPISQISGQPSQFKNLEGNRKEREAYIQNLETALKKKEATLNYIYNSYGLGALLVCNKLIDKMFPHNSRRKLCAKFIINCIRNLKTILKY